MKIWNEEYRPKVLDDMILPIEQRDSFKQYLTSGFFPNLIFYGPPGTGKTSTALIFLRSLGAEFLRLNGSDERSVEIVRNEIKNFIQTKSFNAKRKIVFYDEAEALTIDAYRALKEITERYYKTTSFIFATNHLYRFPEAIRSRCTLFEFKKPPKEEVLNFLKNILAKEKVDFHLEDLETIYRTCTGDLRRTLNYLQQWSMTGKLKLPEEDFGKIVALIKAKDILGLKRYFASHTVDYDSLYRYLFEHISDPKKIIILGKYLYQDSMIVDKEINFVCCSVELMNLAEDK